MSDFQVGDRVRYVGNPSAGWATGVVVAAAQGMYEVLPDDGHRYPAGCAVYRGAGTFHRSLLEPHRPQQLKLERGDRIINNLTKRKGHVVLGSNDELWVVGNDMDEDTGCHASAVEEYEEHHPGTYEITQKASPF